ncbi:MAG: DNA adenine methylase [Eubacterium sp.]
MSQLMIGKLSPEEQIKRFPATRYMGSKSKLLDYIWQASEPFEFNSVLDLFSGSGVVSYMYKAHGKRVISNDYMSMGAIMTKALIQNNNVLLPLDEAKGLIQPNEIIDTFVQDTFKGIYFSDKDNQFIDIVRNNIKKIDNEYKHAIAMEALIRTCVKKRPRGIFTYVGDRYNDGRKDLAKSFEEQFLDAVELINGAVFSNGKKNRSYNEDSMSLKVKADLVYIDPPYYTPKSDNEYVRRYHFVEGLARDWQGVEIQEETKTKKFKSYPTPFSTRNGAADAFDKIFKRYANSILVVSYSSNSLPTMEEMVALIGEYKEKVEVIPIDYKYSFGTRENTTRNEVKEYIFVGR